MTAEAKRRAALHALQFYALERLARTDADCPREVMQYLDLAKIGWRKEAERLAVVRADEMAQDMLDKLIGATPEQIKAYVDTNVTDLASARALFKRILLMLILIAK